MAAEPVNSPFFYGLDLSQYKFIYISYGSKQNEGPVYPNKKFVQQAPYFLEYLHTLPIICISIDRYPTLTIENPNITLLTGLETTYKHVCVPTTDMLNTTALIKELIKALKDTTSPVFVVNFIKYVNGEGKKEGGTEYENNIFTDGKKIRDLIHSPYKYYEWCGYGYSKLMVDFIQIPGNNIVENFLKFHKNKYFLIALNDDKKLKPFLKYVYPKDNIDDIEKKYIDIRSCLLNITFAVTTEQTDYIPGSLSELEHIESKKATEPEMIEPEKIEAEMIEPEKIEAEMIEPKRAIELENASEPERATEPEKVESGGSKKSKRKSKRKSKGKRKSRKLK